MRKPKRQVKNRVLAIQYQEYKPIVVIKKKVDMKLATKILEEKCLFNEKASSIRSSEIKIQLIFEGSTGNFKEIIKPEGLSVDTILSLVGKHFSKKLENFDISGKPYVGTNGDYVGLFIKCNWKSEPETSAKIEVKIRIDKMFDRIIDVLS
jgi:hypothetical protein